MALIVRNTFLDFDVEESSFAGDRRCHSLPRKWKQAAPSRSSSDDRSPLSPDASTRASLRSDFSFYSDEDSCTTCSADASPAADDCAACGWCLGTELAKLSCLSECYLTRAPCEPEFRVPAIRASSTEHVASDDDTSASIVDKDTSACGDAFEKQDIESDGCKRAEIVVDAEVDQPKLDQETLVVDPRMHAVAKAVHSALASCGRAQHIGTQHRDQPKDRNGPSSVTITAEVENGARAFATSYDVVSIAKKELEAAVAQIKTLKLVSSRLQKEDCGYSLRSSIALVPEGLGDRMCWDMFRHGYCARGHQCRWEHPRSSQLDNRKIKINIRHSGEASDVSSEEPHVTVGGAKSKSGRRLRVRSSAGRQTLRSSAGGL